MILQNKNQFRPVYKQLVNLKENVQNREKLMRFKKKKWIKLIQIYKRQLHWAKKFKPKDQTQYLITRHSNLGFSYKNKYKVLLQANKKFKLIYGGLTNKKINLILNKNSKKVTSILFFRVFERRLDVTLYRAKFGANLRFVQQLIYHNKVWVNNKPVKIKSFLLKPGDIIKIKSSYFKLIDTTILQAQWPIYPKNLVVNYKTMEVIFNSLQNGNVFLNVSYHLNLEKILIKFTKNQ